MVIIQPGLGIDITPPSTGFFSILAKSVTSPFSVRSYTCGTSSFLEMMQGNFINMPYYIGSGNCLQLYNPSNSTVDVEWKMITDSPATALFSVSMVVWFLLLLSSYLLILGGMTYGSRVIRRLWRNKNEVVPLPITVPKDEENNTQIVHPTYNQLPPPPKINVISPPPTYNDPSAPTMMYISSFNKDSQMINQGHSPI